MSASNGPKEPSHRVLLDRGFVDAVEQWMLTATSGVLVIEQSQTGCGVSRLLDVLQEEHARHVAWVSMGHHACRRTVLGQKKIMLIDPPDSVIVDAAKSVQFAQLVQTPSIPMIIAGFKRRSVVAKLGAMLKKSSGTVTHLTVPPIPDDDAVNFLVSVAAEKGVEGVDVRHAWSTTHDLRHCLRALDGKGSELREILPDGVQGLLALLQQSDALSFRDRCRIAEGDPSIMVDGIFENYVHGVSTNLEDAVGVLDMLSTCDHLQAFAYAQPSFDPAPLTAALVAGTSACNVDVRKDIKTFGTLWARANHQKVKRKLLKELPFDMNGVEATAYVRQMALSSPDQLRRMVSLFGQDQVWAVTRLWTKSGKVCSKKRFRSITDTVVPDVPGQAGPGRQREEEETPSASVRPPP